MIRNRLAILLAERGLKVTKVHKDTGISRSTLTAINQNEVKMIQLDTIDVLCRYLRITPESFFEFIPLKLSYSVHVENDNKIELRRDRIKLDCYIDYEKENEKGEFILEVDLKFNEDDVTYDGVLKIADEQLSDFSSFISSIPATFITDIKKEIENEMEKEVEVLEGHIPFVSVFIDFNF